MYCRFCGTLISEDSVFCSNCGKPVHHQDTAKQEGEQETSARIVGTEATKEHPPGANEPAIKIVSVTASAYVGQEIDLEKLGKSTPGSAYNSKVNPNFLNYRLKDGSGIAILKSGKVRYLGAESEEEARSAIQRTFAELREKRIQVQADPQISIDFIRAAVFYRRGLEIQSLPEQIPNSIYVRRSGDFLQGTYNKDGVVLHLTSKDEVLKAVGEVSDKAGESPLAFKDLDYFSYCRIKGKVLAQMFRGDDIDGKMLMTGFAEILFASSETEVRESAVALEGMLDIGKLFGPLTPLDKIPQKGRDNPKSLDYFADDPAVWASTSNSQPSNVWTSGMWAPGVRGIAPGFIPAVLVPSGFLLAHRACYNCLRAPVFHDGLSWVESEWMKPFRENAPLLTNVGNPPQTVWICPACARCVICGIRGTKDAPLKVQSLIHEHRIPTIVAYCSNHQSIGMQANGIPSKKIPKELKGAWSEYLAYQANLLSNLYTPLSRERLDGVKSLVKRYR